jgi:hypothetical protein
MDMDPYHQSLADCLASPGQIFERLNAHVAASTKVANTVSLQAGETNDSSPAIKRGDYARN